MVKHVDTAFKTPTKVVKHVDTSFKTTTTVALKQRWWWVNLHKNVTEKGVSENAVLERRGGLS